MSTRTVTRIIESTPTSDGAGVKLRRSLGGASRRLDPFLMLDEFYSDQPEDYIGGFPAHPHRGFETVTYMLDGRMQHQDHLGNTGDLGPGSVQWMTAARGIIHSEMPQQTEGRMRGFQLWLNLPAAEKMKPAAYRDIPADQVTQLTHDSGVQVRIIAGEYRSGAQTATGPIHGGITDPLYLDLRIPAGTRHRLSLTAGYNAMIYPYEGQARVADTLVPRQSAAVLSDTGDLELQADGEELRALVLAGRPLGEPVAQYGPFVMSNQAELDQAMRDYRDGTLTA